MGAIEFGGLPTEAGPTETPEVTLNLWHFVDEETGLVFRLAARAYALLGSDQEKLRVLHRLAGTDFHLAKMCMVPKRYKLTFTDAKTFEGVTRPETAQTDPLVLFKEVVDALEAELPTQARSDAPGGRVRSYRLRIPEDPLIINTCVIEHIDGTLEPRLAQFPAEDTL